MQPHGVILANEHRLLREMLKRAIRKAPGLQVVGELGDSDRLLPLVEETGAQWVIASLSPEGELPEAVASLLDEQQPIRILGVACDGSQAKVRSQGAEDRTLNGVSLDELVAVLRG